MWRPFLIALGLLTRIPAPWRGPPPEPRELGRSVLFYPGIGLLIGVMLVGVARLLPASLDPGVQASLILIGWIWLTGGLHLDGLADTADGWIGGLGDRARALAIMKDPHCGPAGVMALVLMILLKWSVLKTLLEHHDLEPLLFAPLLGRLGIVALFLTLPYARPGGMGAVAAAHLSRPWAIGVILSGMVWIGVTGGPILAMAAGVVWFGLRGAWNRRFGGTTGDAAGAACELIEGVALTAGLF
ncbi:MAG: adenosylcobinamide-GDP ribazoletransferase [Magnetococcales bacterium]|nr:adenosylcobinamide-GDP ribazoletransferase [Magnetococcales bacterium]